MSANAWPFGSCTRSAGVSRQRASVRQAIVASARELGKIARGVVGIAHRRSGHERHHAGLRQAGSVRSSAVSVFLTRSMIRVLKLPPICPAFALEPMRASTSDQVWVYAVT